MSEEVREVLKDALSELESLWDGLYGQNLDILGWHLNGEAEPVDGWFEDADNNSIERIKKVLDED